MPTVGLRVVGAVALALFLLAAFSPLPNLLSRGMAGARVERRAAAIVVLGAGGVRPDGTLSDVSLRRTFHGISLYRRGLAPLLVFSGAPAASGHVEAAIRAELAGECGIPAAAVLTEPTARTTREEARNIGALLRPRGVRTILLVSDAEGRPRAAGVFEKAGFEVVPSPVSDVSDLPGFPEGQLLLARRVAIELLAWTYYRLAGYL
jgi:uncharacterized SAM-binding protein YcdF (DUF218 family)